MWPTKQPRVAKPAGCLVWLHDASILGDIKEEVLASRHGPLKHLSERGKARRAVAGRAADAPHPTSQRRGGAKWLAVSLWQAQSFGQLLFEEMKAQLKEAAKIWPLSSVVLGGFGAGATAALLGLLYPQLAGIAYLGAELTE